MAKFNKLDVPHQWKDEFTKYPHGYSIFEAMSKWVKQVNDMITNINQWNEYLAGFTSTFGELPQQMVELRQEMEVLLSNVNSDLTNITDEVAGLADTLLTHLTNYTSYLESELGEEHIIRTLPNGVKDEIMASEGKLIKRVSDEVIINGSMVDIRYVLSSGYQYARTKAMSNAFGFDGTLHGSTILYNHNKDVMQQILFADRLNEGVDGKYYLTNDYKVQILFAPNTFVNTQSVRDYFNNNPHTLIYQLAEPEIIDLPEVMSPNTREIVRLSAQVDKLINML